MAAPSALLPRSVKHPVLSPCSSSSHSSETRSGRAADRRHARAAQRRLSALSRVCGAFTKTMASGSRRRHADLGSPALQPHARSVCPAATTGVPCVPHAFAPVVRNGNAFTDARVRHTGEMGACPLHKRACPLHKRSHRAAPQTFCLSLPLWPLQVTQRRPLSSCSLQWQRGPLEWAVDITEIELMDPISCPTTWPVLLNIRGENTNCARPF
eukprot:scaffold38259_cov36-Phaeocystis_antarctica.AAC.1